MEYKKKYPIARLNNEYVLLTWDQGYKNIQLFFRNRLVKEIPNASQIKKGLKFRDEELNNIELNFSESPMSINVIIDGIHSSVNASHPVKEMKKFGAIFWMVAIFGIIISALEISLYQSDLILLVRILIFDSVIVASYILSAIYVSKSKPWAFWLGFATFTAMTLLFLLATVVTFNGLSFWVNLITRGIIFIFMLRMINTVVQVSKHQKYSTIDTMNTDLIDNF